MRQLFEIVGSSFRMAIQELWKNKLRTFLSLFGVTIGIFCIIGVLAAVNSLEENIQTTVKSLGSNTIYIDKWEWGGGGPDYPYWKFAKRPSPLYSEMKAVKERVSTARYTAFKIQVRDNISARENTLSGVNIYGVSEEFSNIQPIEVQAGRFMTDAEFAIGSNTVVIGNDIADKLFDGADRALNKEITIRGKKVIVVGIIKKQGKQFIGGWEFDQSMIMPYKFARTIMDEQKADPFIMVQGYEDINSKVLKDELKGAMRAIRKLSPGEEDNFSLNDINDISSVMEKAFKSIDIGGWAIGILAFIVGIFGVANIMFVTVKERTAQIGLKKAIGAKRNTILTEFLLESAFLCIIGGFIGLLLVFILTKIVTTVLNFPVFLSVNIIILAIAICLIAGVLAGIIPASQASRLDPVVAIRSK